MKRRLFIFITGQYRTFWHSWNNLVEKVLKPAEPFFEVYVYIGMDIVWKYTGHLWKNQDRQVFQTHLQNEWALLNYPETNLILEWISHINPYFQQAISSLENYMNNQKLDPYWFNYLVHRSGSCLEYAQVSHLYDIVCSQHKVRGDDLMMRTRADILFRHPFNLNPTPPDINSSTKDVFKNMFPTSQHFNKFEEQSGREVSLFPQERDPNRWVITLRKNLVYIMPLQHGDLLLELTKRYGDWDTPDMNNYWFNAESQFRGCFRHHNFTLWEYSQDKDECYGGFDYCPGDFPIYAIQR